MLKVFDLDLDLSRPKKPIQLWLYLPVLILLASFPRCGIFLLNLQVTISTEDIYGSFCADTPGTVPQC